MGRRRGEVFINARFLTQTTTGVQRYAIEVVKALDALVAAKAEEIAPYSFTLLAPKDARFDPGLEHVPLKRVGRLSGHLWEQLELPFYARHGLLLSLGNAAPLLKRNQVVTMHDAAVFANPRTFSLFFRA